MSSHAPSASASASSLHASIDAHGVSSSFDHQQPLRGVVVCCTNTPPEERSEVDKQVVQLGGIHKLDLTPEVTHLVIGSHASAKYRHVAKERPDVVPMDVGWISALTNLWREDQQIDFAALEKKWRLKALESAGGTLADTANGAEEGMPHRKRLIICLTGFDDLDERQHLTDLIEQNGGIYQGDLTRKVTHLVVYRPEGAKYDAACHWGIHCVAPQWLYDTVARGMILSEACYNPILPKEKLGVDAWTKRQVEPPSIRKRRREVVASFTAEEGMRKLRKTASMKVQSQTEDMWASILGAGTPKDRPDHALVHKDSHYRAPTAVPKPASSVANAPLVPAQVHRQPPPRATAKTSRTVFGNCAFYIHGYGEAQHVIVARVIRGLGGCLCSTLEDAVALSTPEITRKFVVVPQTSPPEAHPALPDSSFDLVTEFFLEKCLHRKRFYDPLDHVLGRPFTLFPIPELMGIQVATGGFTDVDLQQLEKAIKQLGAQFMERFTPKAHVLVCSNLAAVRQQKINLALSWQVPIVSVDWLWDCISMGQRVPVKKYLFDQLHQRADGIDFAPAPASVAFAEPSTVMGDIDTNASRKRNTSSKDRITKPRAISRADDKQDCQQPISAAAASNVHVGDAFVSTRVGKSVMPSEQQHALGKVPQRKVKARAANPTMAAMVDDSTADEASGNGSDSPQKDLQREQVPGKDDDTRTKGYAHAGTTNFQVNDSDDDDDDDMEPLPSLSSAIPDPKTVAQRPQAAAGPNKDSLPRSRSRSQSRSSPRQAPSPDAQVSRTLARPAKTTTVAARKTAAREARRVAERRDLENKLISILPTASSSCSSATGAGLSTTAAPTTATAITKATATTLASAAAPATAVATESSLETTDSSVVMLGSAPLPTTARRTAPPPGASVTIPGGVVRKREKGRFGRAISNASTASESAVATTPIATNMALGMSHMSQTCDDSASATVEANGTGREASNGGPANSAAVAAAAEDSLLVTSLSASMAAGAIAVDGTTVPLATQPPAPVGYAIGSSGGGGGGVAGDVEDSYLVNRRNGANDVKVGAGGKLDGMRETAASRRVARKKRAPGD